MSAMETDVIERQTGQPFFERAGDGFVPQPVCAGPWDPKSLHGRVVAGLLAAEIERNHGDDALIPARLTVDLYRLPDFSPMRVTTEVIREGRRIRVVAAEIWSGDRSAGRATCQLLRKGGEARGKVWARDNWDVPMPATCTACREPSGSVSKLPITNRLTVSPTVNVTFTTKPDRSARVR
jgi:hypothetical protein